MNQPLLPGSEHEISPELQERGEAIIAENSDLIVERFVDGRDMPSPVEGVHRMSYEQGDPLGWAVEGAATKAYEKLGISGAMEEQEPVRAAIAVPERFRGFFNTGDVDELSALRRSAVVEIEDDGTQHTIHELRYIQQFGDEKHQFIAFLSEESELELK